MLLQEREAKRARLKENNAEAYITQDMPSTGNGFISNAAKVCRAFYASESAISASSRDDLSIATNLQTATEYHFADSSHVFCGFDRKRRSYRGCPYLHACSSGKMQRKSMTTSVQP